MNTFTPGRYISDLAEAALLSDEPQEVVERTRWILDRLSAALDDDAALIVVAVQNSQRDAAYTLVQSCLNAPR